MNLEKKRYLVHIRLGKEFQLKQRINEAAPSIKKIIERLSKNEYQLAYTSHDGGTFGFLLKTTYHAHAIRSQINSPGKHNDYIHPDEKPEPVTPSPLRSGDSMLVLEIGEDFAGLGLVKAWTWLQHH